MPGTTTEKYKRNFVNEAKNWDYLVSPNAYSTEIFKRAFDYKGHMIESGYPRNDFLINHTKTMLIRLKTIKHSCRQEVILYAPTWRDDEYYRVGQYKFDIKLDLHKLKSTIGDDYVILLRMHYLIAENIELSSFEGFAYDVSNHLDIRELYVISDMLITDYSSVFFDYANLRRPMIFYVYDLEKYKDQLRGFYFNLEENAPGPLTRTTDEVLKEIQEYAEQDEPAEHFEQFYKKFCYLEDGRSAEQVVNTFYKK